MLCIMYSRLLLAFAFPNVPRNQQKICEADYFAIFVTEWLRKNPEMMRRDVFQAIADPTRREILGLIAGRSLNLNAVADNFEMSRPAISKHMKILSECGLVRLEQKGRERICVAQLDQLAEVNDWVAQYKQFWEEKLDRLEQYLQDLQQKEKDQRNNDE
jgi:DNA-binding transcriptional ArsR family regulator